MVFTLAGELGGLLRPTAWKADLVVELVVEVVEEYGENLEVLILSRPGLAVERLAA